MNRPVLRRNGSGRSTANTSRGQAPPRRKPSPGSWQVCLPSRLLLPGLLGQHRLLPPRALLGGRPSRSYTSLCRLSPFPPCLPFILGPEECPAPPPPLNPAGSAGWRCPCSPAPLPGESPLPTPAPHAASRWQSPPTQCGEGGPGFRWRSAEIHQGQRSPPRPRAGKGSHSHWSSGPHPASPRSSLPIQSPGRRPVLKP